MEPQFSVDLMYERPPSRQKIIKIATLQNINFYHVIQINLAILP